MQYSFTSVPFKTDSGMSQINGVAKFSSAGVVLEFESKLFGLISNGVKEARLATDEILDVKFKKGVLKRGAKIEIRVKSLAKLNELPYKDGKLTLKIQSEDFERARDAVAKLEKDMADEAASLPPYHTSVSSLFDGSEDETKKLDE
ncbi:MAG: hypothetical protein KA956_02375 [Pyrinomonadaceae bacterium]|nr:hypothetical protein [Acidobacteriota bacterium]MBP7375303.1 hypothetical protein [Pyrinomonadaceae bacterium]